MRFVRPRGAGIWPQSLFHRLVLVLFAGLAVAHAAAFALANYEWLLASRKMMLANMQRDIVSGVAILDHVPAGERASWLARLERRTYSYRLGAGTSASPPPAGFSDAVADSVIEALGAQYSPSVAGSSGADGALQVQVTLHDGQPVVIDLRPQGFPYGRWLPLVFLLQLAILAVSSWYAVRLLLRPLSQLAAAADALGPDLRGVSLAEDGPAEVARAARAFNAMQKRIAEHVAERIRMLGAISHDLQTPMTRMRLRLELGDESEQAAKLKSDLAEMENLVREGLAYARGSHAVVEGLRRIDFGAFLESLVSDYEDAGYCVGLCGLPTGELWTRPQALKRILMNLVDNAVKFGSEVQVRGRNDGPDGAVVEVLDRGPGIPEACLDLVFQPFWRLENSRNRETGGTGLGLATARQLAQTLGATLVLANREGGGLRATLTMRAVGGGTVANPQAVPAPLQS